MNARRLFGALIATVLLAIGVMGCGGTPEVTTPPTEIPQAATAEPTAVAVPTQGGELVVAMAYEPTKIDPHRTASEAAMNITYQICEPLLARASDGSPVPYLADSWEVSDDGLDITLRLHQGVKFHDGTPFNAEAVKYNLDRIVDPATMSEEGITYLGPYLSTEVVDEYTVILHYETPHAALLNNLANAVLGMVSPTAAQQWGVDEFQDHMVGTGPFLFKEWKRGEYVRLEKNPDYWGGPAFFEHQGTAYLDSVVYKFVPEGTVRTGILQTGEAHVAHELTTTDVPLLQTESSIRVEVLQNPGTGIILMLNMSKAPTDDLKVRQALNYAIDQVAISDILYQGIMAPSYGPLVSTTPCYWSGVEQMYPYDPEKAKALLAEAGWTDTDGDGFVDKDGAKMVLEFPTHGKFAVYRDPAPIVQAQLKEVGIEVNVQNLAGAGWMEAARTGTHNISVVDWRANEPDGNLRNTFQSENATAFAWTWHTNSHLDDLLTQGMSTMDATARCGIYQEVQQIIMNDAMIKPVNSFANIWGVREEVQGLSYVQGGPAYFWLFDIHLEKQ